ncbi:MAG: hypothetical protein RMK75_01205 [Aquificaceae bacterium]|nr:hypothetical protein [Aquificaceae bacterium]MDW8066930.1 hypothetical protein [Aquificaceae bacterium]MDW8422929.1 hypothetical protein [Aquificaceae bacterium]
MSELDVKILVNGKQVNLKDFPKRVLYNLLLGYVKSLNLEEEPKEVQVYVKLKEENS